MRKNPLLASYSVGYNIHTDFCASICLVLWTALQYYAQWKNLGLLINVKELCVQIFFKNLGDNNQESSAKLTAYSK
jgi:hypothetical protein